MTARLFLVVILLTWFSGSAIGTPIGAGVFGMTSAVTASGFPQQNADVNNYPDLGLRVLLASLTPPDPASASSTATIIVVNPTPPPLTQTITATASGQALITGVASAHDLRVFAQGQINRSVDGRLDALVQGEVTATWNDLITIAADAPDGTPVTLSVTAHFDSSILTLGGGSLSVAPFSAAVTSSASLVDDTSLMPGVGFSRDNRIKCNLNQNTGATIVPCEYSGQSAVGSSTQTAIMNALVGDTLDLSMESEAGIEMYQQGLCLNPPADNCSIPGFTQIQANGLSTFDLNIDVLTPGAFLVPESGASYASVPEPSTLGLLGVGLAGLIAMRRRHKTA